MPPVKRSSDKLRRKTRMFGGKRYTFDSRHSKKSNAKKRIEKLKKEEMLRDDNNFWLNLYNEYILIVNYCLDNLETEYAECAVKLLISIGWRAVFKNIGVDSKAKYKLFWDENFLQKIENVHDIKDIKNKTKEIFVKIKKNNKYRKILTSKSLLIRESNNSPFCKAYIKEKRNLSHLLLFKYPNLM